MLLLRVLLLTGAMNLIAAGALALFYHAVGLAVLLYLFGIVTVAVFLSGEKQ